MASPPDPLENRRKQAKSLLREIRAGNSEAQERVRKCHHKFSSDRPFESFRLADAQFVVAREHGYSSWPVMKAAVDQGKEEQVTTDQALIRNPETLEALKTAAMSFPMTRIVERYRKEHGVGEQDASLHERELRRYLYVAARYPKERWPMVASIDNLWHTFILFTQEYQRFCGALGVPYIHHDPLPEGANPLLSAKAYHRFLTVYRAEFGEPPNSVWPVALKGGDSNCFSCEQPCEGNCASSG